MVVTCDRHTKNNKEPDDMGTPAWGILFGIGKAGCCLVSVGLGKEVLDAAL